MFPVAEMRFAVISLVVIAVGTIVCGLIMLPRIRRTRSSQPIRDNGPQSHLSKAGTPTFGGLFFLIPITLFAIHVFKVQSAIIVTQRFHLQRALYIGGKLGLDCVGYATNPRSYLSTPYFLAREIGARLKAVYETNTNASPERMSPPYPISGDGRGTRKSF
jgi:uncharacterized SAM-binding protein YcdF (DUF218 family)